MKVGDTVVFTAENDPNISTGSVGKILKITGCGCKPDRQSAMIEFNGNKYNVTNFRSKVTLQ